MVIGDPFDLEKKNLPVNSHTGSLGSTPHQSLFMPLPTAMDRLAAVIVDIFIVLAPVFMFLSAPFQMQITKALFLNQNFEFILAILSVAICFFGVGFVYFFLTTYFFGASLGKKLFSMKIVRIWDLSHPDLTTSFVRSLTWLFDTCLLAIPHLAVLSNPKRRAFHDRVSDTIVISTRDSDAGAPGVLETAFVRGILSGAFVFVFMLILLTTVGLLKTLKSDSLIAGAMEDQGMLCELVGKAQRSWSDGVGSPYYGRLETAMTLYAAGNISEPCLQSEAEVFFGQEQESAMAYLAKAFTYADKPEISNAYLQKVCALDKESEECLLSEIVKQWSKDEWSRIDKEFLAVDEKSRAFMKIWAVRHFINRENYSQALALLFSVPQFAEVNSFLARQKIKSYWGLGRLNEARSATDVALESIDKADQIDLAAWMCYEEVTRSCDQMASTSCKKFSDAIAKNQDFLKDGKWAMTYIRNLECQKPSAQINYKNFAETIQAPELKEFIQALIESKSGSAKKAESLFNEIASSEDAESYLRAEAFRRLIEGSYTPVNIIGLLNTWRDQELNLESLKSGERLLSKLFKMGLYKESYIVGQRLLQFWPDSHEWTTSLVVSAYKLGLHKQAWRHLRGSTPQVSEIENRSPASFEEFSLIRGALVKEFEGQ